ncbi:MAG: phage holin family protein [Dehalococcoidia bacterium]|nr:phage holin family protein [Dehalococcoidia bacterium]
MHVRSVFVAVGSTRRPTRGEKLVAFFVRWAILAVAVWVAASLIDGIHLDGFGSTLLVALILGLLNALLRPVLFWITLPLTVLSLGLFLLILNTAMLGLTAWIAGKFDDIHLAIDGFWDAFWGALIISLVAWVIGWFVNADRIARRVAR